MIIFLGKTDRTIKDLTVPDNLCIVTQEKAWMDERLFGGGMVRKNLAEICAQKNKISRFSQVLDGNGCV